MDIVHYSMATAVFLIKAASIVAMIYVPMIVGARWLPKIDDTGMFLQSDAWNLPLFAGAVIGGGMVYYNLDPEYFTVDNIFRTDGPWSLTYAAFLRDRINPFNYYFEPVVRNLSLQNNLPVVLVFAAAAFAVVRIVMRCFSTWRSLGAWRGIVYSFAILVWACYMTIFGVCLALWVLNLVNFWVLLIFAVAIQLHRHQHFPLDYYTLMAPVWGDAHGHGGHGHGGHGHGGGHGHDDHGGGHGGHDAHGGGHGGHDSHGGGHGHDSHGGGHGGHDAHGGGHGGHDSHGGGHGVMALHDSVHPLRGHGHGH